MTFLRLVIKKIEGQMEPYHEESSRTYALPRGA